MQFDDLEKFIEGKKDQFDRVEQPDLNRLWGDFNRNQHSITSRRKYWMLAATIAILLALTAGLIGYNLGENRQPTLASLLVEDHDLAEHYTQLTSEIARREKQLEAKNIQKQDFQSLFLALEELDGMQQVYEADLVSYSNEQALIKSLLQHHEKKIRLLELLLFEVEKKSENEQRDQFSRL